MNILILGATGFIGTNLALKVANINDNLILHGRNISNNYKDLFSTYTNVSFVEKEFSTKTDFLELTKGIDVVYHLASSTIPSSSEDMSYTDIAATIKLLDSIVVNKCSQIVFVSSGGAIYGNNLELPFNELTNTNPISAYGIQKLAIEKYLYLYKYKYGINYKIIRLSNPYGRFQRANHGQGIIATFIYRALLNDKLEIYGDGKKIRDYIYIDDAINGILKISNNGTKYNLYNLGSGCGLSINSILEIIMKYIKTNSQIIYKDDRKFDVNVNYLDIGRFKDEFGDPITVSIDEGIVRTINYWKEIL